jgi:hypothetical protein
VIAPLLAMPPEKLLTPLTTMAPRPMDVSMVPLLLMPPAKLETRMVLELGLVELPTRMP